MSGSPTLTRRAGSISWWFRRGLPLGSACALLLGFATSAGGTTLAAGGDSCVVARIESGASPLAERLRGLAAVDYWIEADRELLLCARGGRASGLGLASAAQRAGAVVAAIHSEIRPERLRFWRGGRRLGSEAIGRVLIEGGRWAVIELAAWSTVTESTVAEPVGPGPERVAQRFQRFVPDTVLARRQRRVEAAEGEALTDPQIEALLSELDAGRWFADLSTLAGWNRWTRGSQILSARDWLEAAFEGLDGVSATTASFPVGANTGWNVIATLPGTLQPDDWYVVGGHYDSTSENPASAAPGAEDNASGCAGVLELARLFAAHPPDATMVFVCFSGEEQGLYGSYDYVADLAAAGDLAKVQGALIFDMIGYTADPELDCLLETDAIGQGWMTAFAAAAADFTTLEIVETLGAWGSDHVPFLDAGRVGLLAIENDYGIYPHYHRTTDLPVQITPEMGLQILRMGAAGLTRLVGSTAIFADGFESGGLQRWSEVDPP